MNAYYINIIVFSLMSILILLLLLYTSTMTLDDCGHDSAFSIIASTEFGRHVAHLHRSALSVHAMILAMLSDANAVAHLNSVPAHDHFGHEPDCIETDITGPTDNKKEWHTYQTWSKQIHDRR